MPAGWVYIITNKPFGTLYIGVTSNLQRRIWEHREGQIEGFSKSYGLRRLVYSEEYNDIVEAIQRETQLKWWRSQWKIDLISKSNPGWRDLYEALM